MDVSLDSNQQQKSQSSELEQKPIEHHQERKRRIMSQDVKEEVKKDTKRTSGCGVDLGTMFLVFASFLITSPIVTIGPKSAIYSKALVFPLPLFPQKPITFILRDLIFVLFS